MGTTMSCHKRANNPQPDLLRTAQEIALDVYIWFFKDRKLERPVAVQQMSLALGVTERTGWSLLKLEPTLSMPGERLHRLRAAYCQHLQEQEEELKRRSDRARLRRQQQELELRECGKSSRHLPSGGGTGI